MIILELYLRLNMKQNMEKDDLTMQVKMLSPKQILQLLPMALEQVKADNTSGNLLNEIRQIIYFLYQAKWITKKVYNKIIDSIELYNRIDTILWPLKIKKKLILIDYYPIF